MQSVLDGSPNPMCSLRMSTSNGSEPRGLVVATRDIIRSSIYEIWEIDLAPIDLGSTDGREAPKLAASSCRLSGGSEGFREGLDEIWAWERNNGMSTNGMDRVS